MRRTGSELKWTAVRFFPSWKWNRWIQAFSWSASNGRCLPVFRGVYPGT